MYDDWGCAPDCEYCDTWREEQEEQSRVRAQKHRERMEALPDDSPEKQEWLRWQKLMQPYIESLLSMPPLFSQKIDGDQPVKFAFWKDLTEEEQS